MITDCIPAIATSLASLAALASRASLTERRAQAPLEPTAEHLDEARHLVGGRAEPLAEEVLRARGELLADAEHAASGRGARNPEHDREAIEVPPFEDVQAEPRALVGGELAERVAQRGFEGAAVAIAD